MFLEFNGKKINYQQKGEGQDILVLHGFGANIYCMSPITNYFCNFGRVTVIDFLGFGESDSVDNFTVSDYVEMLEFVIKSLELDLFMIIAHSFGGRVAIKFASCHSELPKLVLTDSAGVLPKHGIKYHLKVKTYKILRKLPVIKHHLSGFGSVDYKGLDDGMRRTFVNIVNEDLLPYAEQIKSETLLIYGENDKDTPVYMANKLHEKIDNSAVIIVKNAGHFCYAEQSVYFNRIVESFLNG